MENASKALIIAGAILISILLISVGIIVMNAINDPVSQAGDSAAGQAIEMFNSKFTTYEGKQKGSALKSLVSTVNASNGTDDDHQVLISKTASGSTSELTSAATLTASKEYTVTVKYATTNGENETGVSGKKVKSQKGYVFEINIAE